LNQFFFDTNILLDYCLSRQPFEKDAQKAVNLVFTKQVKGYVSALSFANMFYLLRKENSRDKILDFFKLLRSGFTVIAVDDNIIESSIASAFTDFEDAVQYFCAAKIQKLDAIITRNEKDFKKGAIDAMNCEEFLLLYNSKK
jgi:predicted nucleic acid-binding protein